MVRRLSVIVLALTLHPALVRAQDSDSVLTISVPSANVHKGPSTATPVIGHVSRGAVLSVSRNLGSWVKVAWPEAPDGVGYVHVTMGRIRPVYADANVASPSSPASPRPAATTVASKSPVPPVAPMTAPERVAPKRRTATVTPASHMIGVGALAASTTNFGATARAWSQNRIGIQLGLTRDAMTNDTGRVTSVQFEPGVVYGLFDRITDYVWVRPYVGSVISFRRETMNIVAPVAFEAARDSNVGVRVFGGSELMFASLPRFAVSVDAGYRRFPTPFPGFESGRMSASVAGHWYIR